MKNLISKILNASVIALAVPSILLAGIFLFSLGFQQLVISPFHVFTELSAKGLDGDVLAAHFLDQLSSVDRRDRSVKSATFNFESMRDQFELQDQSNAIGNIKVNVPNTGISTESLDGILRMLGRKVNITGEVFVGTRGPAVEVRLPNAPAVRDSAPAIYDGIFPDAIIEEVYARLQPEIFINYTMETEYPNDHIIGRDATDALVAVSQTGTPAQRAWAYWWLAHVALRPLEGAPTHRQPNYRDAFWWINKAVEADSSFPLAVEDRAYVEGLLGEDGLEYADTKVALRILKKKNSGLNELARTERIKSDENKIYGLEGNFAAERAGLNKLRVDYNGWNDSTQNLEVALAAETHDLRTARAALSKLKKEDPLLEALVDIKSEKYDDARRDLEAARAEASSAVDRKWEDFRTQVAPALAIAAIRLGSKYEPVVSAMEKEMPTDCYTCAYTRAEIKAEEGDWKAADKLFQVAVEQAPDLPLAHYYYGSAGLRFGHIPGALKQLRLAEKISPGLAEPAERLSELFSVEHDYVSAIRQARQAVRDSPQWARAQIALGRALEGHHEKDGADKAFAKAATLGLTACDRDFRDHGRECPPV